MSAKRSYLKAGEACDYLAISYPTLRKYLKEGRLKGRVTPAGQTVFTRSELDALLGRETVSDETGLVFYVRDSEGDQSRLDAQERDLRVAYGEPERVYKDKASGLNENRKGLTRLLRDVRSNRVSTVCITNRDRLTRFGYSYLASLMEDHGVRLMVLNEDEDQSPHEELLRDFMSLLASFSGKYYKLRGLKAQRSMMSKVDGILNKESGHE